jgi:hypothetical protein
MHIRILVPRLLATLRLFIKTSYFFDINNNDSFYVSRINKTRMRIELCLYLQHYHKQNILLYVSRINKTRMRIELCLYLQHCHKQNILLYCSSVRFVGDCRGKIWRTNLQILVMSFCRSQTPLRNFVALFHSDIPVSK